MKRLLRIIAVLIAFAAVGFWLALGANRGWTKNQVPVTTVDELTGQEGIKWKKQFVPGVDFLAITAGAAVLLGGLSFLFRTKKTELQTSIPQQQT